MVCPFQDVLVHGGAAAIEAHPRPRDNRYSASMLAYAAQSDTLTSMFPSLDPIRVSPATCARLYPAHPPTHSTQPTHARTQPASPDAVVDGYKRHGFARTAISSCSPVD